jgi:Mg2+-importing ATPase
MLYAKTGKVSSPDHNALDGYWGWPAERAIADLQSAQQGLTNAEAGARLVRSGPNALRARPRLSALRLFIRQFESPLILILIFAAIVAGFAHEWMDAVIVIAILLGSGVLGFVQEFSASSAIEKLRARISISTTVIRDGVASAVPSEHIVPGDVVLLSAGNLIPADGLVLESKDFFVVQAVLTGEPLPVEKSPELSQPDASLAERTNCVFMGTSVRSGTARVLIVRTGPASVFGGIAGKLRLRSPETEFERGIRRYGLLLTEVMLVLVIITFAANVFLARPPIDSLLFAVALAVGMSPELLPAIISITLSQGAREMAARGVIVRRLSAIENLGSMDVLCTDKTGTLTEGVMGLDAAMGPNGEPNNDVLRLAYLNAKLQTGLVNPLDEAIIARCAQTKLDISHFEKLDEVPYDFIRKRLSVVVREGDDTDGVMIVKGALDNILEVCDQARDVSAVVTLDHACRQRLQDLFAGWSAEGYRVLGLATKRVAVKSHFGRDDEQSLVFAGFLLFMDPLKPGIKDTINVLKARGVALKIITGDNHLVAVHLAEELDLKSPIIMTGREMNDLGDEAFWHRAERTDLFAEVDPNQKERIILALKRTGHVVGYLGDGINDAPALHAADVGISVDQAVDVAKEAADFVLLKRDLEVLNEGVEYGRRTFANTLKYVSITTSANFGNMISMALASFFLPFLPMLATQILLNNFLSDLPAVNIASDNVDPELISQPHRWDIRLVRNLMLTFGLISSAFDILTFGVLLWLFHAQPAEFRTAWFIESLLTELMIIFIIRTRRPLYRSTPGRLLILSTAAVFPLALAIPYLPFARFFDFVPLPPALIGVLLLITALYVVVSELTKRALPHTS